MNKYTCKCGKYDGWIKEGQVTTACPSCGIIYEGLKRIDNIGCTEIYTKEIKKKLTISEVLNRACKITTVVAIMMIVTVTMMHLFYSLYQLLTNTNYMIYF